MDSVCFEWAHRGYEYDVRTNDCVKTSAKTNCESDYSWKNQYFDFECQKGEWKNDKLSLKADIDTESASSGSFLLGFGASASVMAAAWATYRLTCGKKQKTILTEPLL